MTNRATTAVVMARGLGSRMQRDAPGTVLTPVQRAAADLGLKSMIPDTRHRPFLDHLLSALADGGVREVILVVAPDHAVIRNQYSSHRPTRLMLHYAVQAEATGTADAMLAAESAVAGRPFLVCNADNLYPVSAIASLVTAKAPAVAAFDRQALIAMSNIDPDRVASFAILSFNTANHLTGIIEKPGATQAEHAAPWIGMNLWRFDQQIFVACRNVPVSTRGERELPQAVALAITHGMTIRAVPIHAGVLDLSARSDVATVAAILGEQPCNP
jgi:glucose-1-phosphate thymidylyltransferase